METNYAPACTTTAKLLTQVAKTLGMLRQSNALHMAGNPEAAIDLEREARVILAGLLLDSGFDTTAAQTEGGQS